MMAAAPAPQRPPWALLAGAVLAAHLALLLPWATRDRLALPSPGRVLYAALPPMPAPPEEKTPEAPVPAAPPATAIEASQATTVPPRKVSAVPVPGVPAAPLPTAPPALAAAPAAEPAAAAAPATAPAPTTAAAFYRLPPSMRMRFQTEVHRAGQLTQTETRLAWRHDGQQYEALLETQVAGRRQRAEHSVGRLGPEGLAPTRYGLRGRGEQATHFESDKGQVSFSNNQPPQPLEAGAQDRLSVVFHLAALVAGDPTRYPAGSAIAIQTAGPRQAPVVRFLVEGPETLQLPGGTMATLKFSRAPVHEWEPRFELWLAPGLDYAPVRMRLTGPRGDGFDHRWLSADNE